MTDVPFDIMTAFEGERQSLTKREILRALLQLPVDRGHLSVDDIESVLEEVLRRETLGSTGIGQGVAIPHARHPAVLQPLLVCVLCRPAVDFDCIDAEPADILVLLLMPHDPSKIDERRTTAYGHELMRKLGDEPFRGSLRRASSEDELKRILVTLPSFPAN
jgi:nitrogen PTS system EIIA component